MDERSWSGFGRVGFLRIYREQPRCIRGPLGLNLRELGGGALRWTRARLVLLRFSFKNGGRVAVRVIAFWRLWCRGLMQDGTHKSIAELHVNQIDERILGFCVPLNKPSITDQGGFKGFLRALRDGLNWAP